MSSEDSEDFRITRMVIIVVTIIISLLIIRYTITDIMERFLKMPKEETK